MGISHRYTFVPSLLNILPAFLPIPPPRLSQSPSLSSLNHTTNFHWLSILHMVMYVSMLLSPSISPSPPFLHVHKLTDEWIKKLWYIYTMEYYLAIKRNTFESVLMRWMNLEHIIQSEVSQKEKDSYHILMHVYGI